MKFVPGWSWDPLTEQWEEVFEQLQSYVEKHGKARVPYNYVTADGLNLGRWINTQRQNQSKNLLSLDRIERLEALPGWSWDPYMEQWEEAFEQLQYYVKQQGNAKVPATNGITDNFKLGTWASNQRTNKSKNLLSHDRIERLEALPGWSWDPYTEQWEEAFEQLQYYVKQHGNAKVPATYGITDNFKLGTWASNQRKNKSKNLLSQDRVERLEALSGWSWDRLTDRWEEAFEQLQSYVLRPAIFKVIRPSLFEVSQWILSRAFTGITHTEDSARQPAGFQAIFFLRQGCKGSQKLISCCF